MTFRGVTLWFTAAMVLSSPAISTAQQIASGDYPIPTAASQPDGITNGPDGAVWFTEFSGNKIGRITPAGAITDFPIPTPYSQPVGIATGPDGALWFTEYATSKIGRVTTAGLFTEYSLPASSYPAEITAGPDGALWFTEELYMAGNQIGRITTEGVITGFPLPTYFSNPDGITTGPDGALWFTESIGNSIGRITTAGSVTEYPLPTSQSYPTAITTGPDGALWFTEYSYAAPKIGRITTAGAITEYPVPGAYGITQGPDGALWFTQADASPQLGRITTAGAITEYPLPNGGGGYITVGPDNELWFAQTGIGQAVFVTAGLSVTPAKGFHNSPLEFTGTGFSPGEHVQIYVSGVGSNVLVSVQANSGGAFTVASHAPQSGYGPRIFLGVGQTSGRLGAASFFMQPELVLTPNSGPVGTVVKVQGYGFSSLQQVKVYWPNPYTYLGSVISNVEGTFNGSSELTFDVPDGSPAGVEKPYGMERYLNAKGYGSFTVE